MIYLLITADDFGKDSQTNRAIVIAKEEGVLTSASIMIVGKEWKQAIEMAKQKDIDVGLHISITEGSSIALNKKIRFSPAILGLLAQFQKKTISWIKEEISLQFRRFANTGINFSHVDSHHHIHIHPKLLDIIIKKCQEYSIKSIRFPFEPWTLSSRISKGHPIRNIFYRWTFYPLSKIFMKKVHLSNIKHPDGVFGLYKTGEITEDWLLILLDRLQYIQGVFEIYLHPVDMKNSPGFKELKALTSHRVAEKIKDLGIKLISFSQLPEIIHA